MKRTIILIAFLLTVGIGIHVFATETSYDIQRRIKQQQLEQYRQNAQQLLQQINGKNYKQTPQTYQNSSKSYQYNSTKPQTNLQKPIATNTASVKAKLDAIAMSILKDVERHKGSGSIDENKVRQMIDLGVTGMCDPTIDKRPTPHCELREIKVNGKTLKGDLCGFMCYEFEGKQYDVGYCK